MGTFFAILPLAFVMIAGPQIISAIFLATGAEWRRNSPAYLAGAGLAISLFVAAAYFVADGAQGAGGDSDDDSGSTVINAVVLALLLFAAIQTFRKRGETKPPKWMGRLQEATPAFSFKLGFLLLGVFPTDVVTSIAVGGKLAADEQPIYHAAGFVGVTLLLLAVPALLLLVLGKRGQVLLPKVRDWMNTNSWIVSEIVIVLFTGITISSLVEG
jgi:hypothetical protein